MPKPFYVTDLSSQLQQDVDCVYCHTGIVLNDHIVICDNCHSPHHVDCWQTNNNECAVFGCDSTVDFKSASASPTSEPTSGWNLFRFLFPGRSSPELPEFGLSPTELSPTELPLTGPPSTEPSEPPSTSNPPPQSPRGRATNPLTRTIPRNASAARPNQLPPRPFFQTAASLPLWIVVIGANLLVGVLWYVSRTPAPSPPVQDEVVAIERNVEERLSVIDEELAIPARTLENGVVTTQLRGYDGDLQAASFSPNGEQIITGGTAGAAYIWDVATGEPLTQLRSQEGVIWAVAFSSDGTHVATGGGYSIRVWDLATEESISYLTGHTDRVRTLAFSPDGTQIVSSSSDGTVRVWDIANGQEVMQLVGGELGALAASFSPDGTRVVSGGWDGTARVWDAATGQELSQLRGHDSGVLAVAFSPNGDRIVSGGWDGTVRLWDVATGAEVTQFAGHHTDVVTVSFSPDGTQVISGGSDMVRVWDAVSGAEVRQVRGHANWLLSASFSSDGDRFFSGDVAGLVQTWDNDAEIISNN